MKTQEIPARTKSKSVLDMTPYELAMLDNYQNRNRGYIDNSDEELENVFDVED